MGSQLMVGWMRRMEGMKIATRLRLQLMTGKMGNRRIT